MARGISLATVLLVSGSILFPAVQSPRATVAPTERPDADGPPTPTRERDEPRDSHIVELDRDSQEKGGIETAAASPVVYRDQVRCYGTVLPLDRLISLYNASLIDAAQLRAAKLKMAASRVASDRAQSLLKVFPNAKAPAETAEATVEQDGAGVALAEAQIQALRNTAVAEWGPVLGEAIASRSALARDLVERRTVLVQISLQPGTTVTPPPTLAFSPGEAAGVDGQLISEAAQADPKIQAVGYLYSVPASAGLLPGVSMLAVLPKGENKPGLRIPPSAVVWQAGRPWLYLRTAPDRFERRPIVETAAPLPEGGYVVPKTSLAQDGTIVVAGAQVLLSQEMRAQIPSDEDDR